MSRLAGWTLAQKTVVAILLSVLTLDFVVRVLVIPDDTARVIVPPALPKLSPMAESGSITLALDQWLPLQARTESSEPEFVLRGIIRNGRDLVAFIETQESGRPLVRRLRLGEAISGWTIESLSLDGVAVRRDQEVRELKMFVKKSTENAQ
jgi:hypothetical protein